MSLERTRTVAVIAALALSCVHARPPEAFTPPEGCRLERRCNGMVGYDCNSAADGPYFYVREATSELLATCGGACMSGGCTSCPPPGWTCPTY